jgi:alkanesulfonate monooxygenase SsuD/methylene tetrahydromethanopterin reductase-like flavin-dependent oxidoreductase (luciferase family)
MSEFKNMISSSIVGSSETVKNKINYLKDDNDFDELTILTWCHDEKERINSYKIFSEIIN